MYQKILFPVDKSLQAKNALTHVADIAGKFNAQVLFLNIFHFPPNLAHYYGVNDPTIQELKDKMIKDMEDYMNEMKKDLDGKGITTRVMVAEGIPGPTIVETAEREKCDLVIVGRRGLGAVKGWLLGSVSNYILHNSNCPVLIVGAEE